MIDSVKKTKQFMNLINFNPANFKPPKLKDSLIQGCSFKVKLFLLMFPFIEFYD